MAIWIHVDRRVGFKDLCIILHALSQCLPFSSAWPELEHDQSRIGKDMTPGPEVRFWNINCHESIATKDWKDALLDVEGFFQRW